MYKECELFAKLVPAITSRATERLKNRSLSTPVGTESNLGNKLPN